MDIEFVAAGAALKPKTAVGRIVHEGAALDGAAAQAAAASRFTGAKGQTMDVLAPAGTDAARLVLVGAGKAEAADALAIEQAAATAYAAVKASGLEILRLELPDGSAELAARAALGVRLASYRFDKYRTKEPAEKKPSVVRTEIVAADSAGALKAFAPLAALADAVSFTRDLVSEPPNVLYPAEFAA
ncbi:MAG: leucyl aminopeptidase, partial [Proteobacteria bacterium]|nr:leucyl aminopeptidase [Pseudomonadota bacterium]